MNVSFEDTSPFNAIAANEYKNYCLSFHAARIEHASAPGVFAGGVESSMPDARTARLAMGI